MKKKIIFVHLALWIGGIEIALVNMLNRMDYDKYDVTCLIVTAYDDGLSSRITPRCRLYRIDREHTLSFRKKYAYYWLYKISEKPSGKLSGLKALRWKAMGSVRFVENILYINYIKSLIKDETFDTAIIFSGKVAELTIKAIKANKYISFYHYSDMRHVYHDSIGYKKSSAIVAVSNNLADELKEFMPEYKNKIIAVHNLTDIDYIRKRAQEATKERFEPDNFNIVTCGRLVKDKGMDLAVEVCHQLVKLGYGQIRWWIIGEGPEHQNLQKLIDEKGVGNYVKLLGQKENPYSYMAQCSLYVQTSRIEAFGLTILEAMIVGCPVVSTNTNGGRELIDSGKNGVLCSCSVQEILATIQILINDRLKMTKLKEVVKDTDFEFRNKSIMERIETLL